MGAYSDRRLYRDSVGSMMWKVGVLLTAVAVLLTALNSLSWLIGVVVMAPVTWRIFRAGVWMGADDVLIVHPVIGRRRVPRVDIERFIAAPFNQWMIAWAVLRTGSQVPCQGISSGRKRTERVDVVVAQLNAALAESAAPT